ncbi:lipoprotein-releasing ABC transporter ATP-binding protein LolD [Basilea psittacipulmonis]|uniref:Lipoprotein-releasing system ATP-binding protein LolD n=1 Tax=Basilea psittacipulmonis DSM 24701 TaxID=1072685 RepID=A0A077DCC9_9BURK|nr:lipoprotein-releasing ABC transporter ATP-binding protein LolD [Basilea psittacipulmonis]AIL32555.1 lipoprotein ABC transporter ATP-binding protein [Basilea psittacipulmonis DSM 24701]
MINVSSHALKATSIYKSYAQGNDELQILKGIDLEIQRGEMLAIMGSSGSGKSTLLHILGTLDLPTSGQLWIDGVEIGSLSEKERSRVRNEKLGFVYQFHHLLPEFNALDNIAMPLILRRMPKHQAREKAAMMLEKIGLAARAMHMPGQLSGGERQRVALARALVTDPVCVLADEPTGNLDNETAERMYDLLCEVNQLFKTSFLIVTHDAQLASKADRCLYMEKGKLQV